MNIVFIASLKSYTTAVSFIKSFKKLGNNLIVLSDVESEYIKIDYQVENNFNVNDFIVYHKINPDFLFFCEGGSMKLFPQGLANVSCKTAWYGIDTHMDLEKHLKIANFFDITLIAQKQYLKYFHEKGFVNTFWLPLAYDSSMSPSQKFKRIFDIAYVGSTNKNMHPERFKLIEMLQKAFPDSYFGSASGEEMYKIYSQAKIVFNKSINNDINMRYFEAMGNGAMLLTDQIVDNGVDNLFEKNKHYLEYTESNIIELVRNYLGTNQDFSNNLEAYIIEKHTYDIRVLNIVEIINRSNRRTKVISQIDYLEIYLMFENFVAFLKILKKIVQEKVIKKNMKRKIVFFPIVFFIDLISFLLKKLWK